MNKVVKAEALKESHQNPEHKLKIQQEIKQNLQIRDLRPQVWPPGHTQATEMWVWLRFRSYLMELWGANAPLIFRRSPPFDICL